MAITDQKMLTFSLGEENYGIYILKVKEIIGMMPITRVPKTPDFIKGIINLRGKIIPVMDLRLKFSMEPIPYDERTCIVILQVNIHSQDRMLGVVVDSVSEVVNISAEDIEPAPEYSSDKDINIIEGIGKIKNKVVIILDIDKVVSGSELMHVLNVDASTLEKEVLEV